MTTEQRTKFRTAVRGLGGERIHRSEDFAFKTGAVVPERYSLRPLPEEIIETVPEYRGYDYEVVDDDVVVIEPESREIVEVLE